MNYTDFLQRKMQIGGESGFAPLWMPDFLFDFQRHLVDWAIRKGRGAIFADCGLGKTPLQLTWAENMVRHTNKPVLILAPIAVSLQTVREAEKFGIEAERVSTKISSKVKIFVCNYERLHHFDPADFAGVVCDESSILKNVDGKTKAAVTEFMRTLPYRLLCTATAAPNDFDELGTSAEALGELGYQDMITKFFKQVTTQDYLGWGRTKYKIRGHAQKDFWRWVCSWARACRRPSDLGFDDGPFVLPELTVNEHEVSSSQKREGFLFDVPAVTLQEQQEEQRRTLTDRCLKVAELVDHDKPAVCWCHLNPEGDMLERIIPGSVQVSGKDSDEAKEEKLLAFADGKIRVLITKPRVAGFGLNWQHCAHQTYFPSHSWEQWYQGVRRSWRFGQKNPVVVDMVVTEGSSRVKASLQTKSRQAEEMFSALITLMNESLSVSRPAYGTAQEEIPAWLSSSRN